MLTVVAEPVPIRIDEHGTARVAGTRLTLDVFVGFYDQGYSPADLVDSFPFLDLADVYAVLSYVHKHRAEVDEYLLEGERVAAETRARIEARQGPQTGLRERLLARRNQQMSGA